MKSWLDNVVVFIWVTLFLYLVNFFEIPKNIYYFLIGVPLIFGGVFLILYLFEKSDKNKT
ncbi:putative membrane protein [Anoxybacillus calidus]|jgi:hypothetical protein|uniref:Putative membrane protein n=1 Tax=[Anoxybacillus] calidus TaxID=575178 RepID=A0A7V9YZW5_9BACL|nr:putative membrane protein [Anoxybacillus calidus]